MVAPVLLKSTEHAQPFSVETAQGNALNVYRTLFSGKRVDEPWPNCGAYEYNLRILWEPFVTLPEQTRAELIPNHIETLIVREDFRLLKDLYELENPSKKQTPVSSAQGDEGLGEDARLTLSKKGKKRFKTLSMSEIKQLPSPKFLVPGVLQQIGSSLLFAPPGTCKTFLILDIAFRLAYGMDWQGRKLPQSNVIYIYGEGKTNLKNRIEAWQQYHKQPDTNAIQFICAPVELIPERGFLCETIEDQEKIPGLIILDTFSVCAGDIQENDNSDVARFIAVANYIADFYETHVHIIHHTNKSGDYRGAVAFKGNVNTMISLNREDRNAPIIMHCEKQKDAEEFTDIRLQLKQVEIGFDPDTQLPITSCIIVAADGGGENEYISANNKREQTTMLEVLTTYGRLTGNSWASKCKALGVSARAFKEHVIVLKKEKRVTYEEPIKKGTAGYYQISAIEKLEQMIIEQGSATC